MILYRTMQGHFVEQDGSYYCIDELSFDTLVAHEDLQAYLTSAIGSTPAVATAPAQHYPCSHRQAGSLGRRSHLLPQPQRAHGRVERRRRRRLLRPRLLRRAPRALLQIHRASSLRSQAPVIDPQRRHLVRARARAYPGSSTLAPRSSATPSATT